jgi:hypothetical protein
MILKSETYPKHVYSFIFAILIVKTKQQQQKKKQRQGYLVYQ